MIDIKKFLKGLRILNDNDQTKSLEVSVSNSATTGTKVIVSSKQNKNTTFELPNTPVLVTTDELVSNKSVQDLENKTLTSPIVNDPVVSGGSIDGADINASPIGQTTPVAVAATAFTATSASVSGDTVTTNTATQTLTNKTLTSPTVNTPSISNGSIAGTSIDNAVIGATTPAAATFTTVDATSVNVGGAALVTETGTQTLTNKTLTSPVLNTPDINNGSIDGATINSSIIGATTPAAATFTTVDATSASISGDTVTTNTASQSISNKTITTSTLNSSVIGATTPAAATFTSLASTSASVSGDTVTTNTASQTLTNKQIAYSVSSDSTTTGASATLAAFSTGIVRLTNGSLVSLSGIPSGVAGQALILENKTGTNIDIFNEDSGATAANRILTGTSSTVSMSINASFIFTYDSTSSRWMLTGGSGSGSGSGGINYITNGEAETGTTGWVSYDDGNVTRPIDGTGSSAPNLTLSTTNSSPLRGDNSFSLLKGSPAIRGTGYSYDFTIDAADKGKVLNIEMDYILTADPDNVFIAGSPTQDSSYIVYIYDITNARLIEPSNFKLYAKSLTTPDKYTGTFQAASNSTSYRLIIHLTQTAFFTYTLMFDSVKVSPSNYVFGTPITDEQSYAPTLVGFGTATAVAFTYSRFGDKLIVRGTFTPGTTTATTATVSLPNGYVIDSTKIGTNIVVGKGTTANVSGTNFGTISILATGSASVLNIGAETSATTGLTPVNGNGFVNSGQRVSFYATIPITGLSSSVQMSSDASTRVVAARYRPSAANSTAANNPFNFDTVDYDTHGAVTTGSGWKFTAPVQGKYKVSSRVFLGSANYNFNLYKNGTALTGVGYHVTNQNGTALTTVELNAGDYIDIRTPDGTVNFSGTGGLTLTQTSHIEIERVSGPSAIAANESVNSRYFASSTTVTSSLATVVWTTKDFDSHLGMSSGLYTIPTTGKYQVNTALALSGTFALNSISVLEIQKNSTAVANVTKYSGGAVTNETIQTSDIINCIAGDVLRIQVSSTGTSPAIIASNTKNFVSVTKVGN